MTSNDNTPLHLLFVYGVLKPGESCDFYFRDQSLGQATYLGEGTTESKYPLIVTTEFNLPLLLEVKGEGHVSMI